MQQLRRAQHSLGGARGACATASSPAIPTAATASSSPLPATAGGRHRANGGPEGAPRPGPAAASVPGSSAEADGAPTVKLPRRFRSRQPPGAVWPDRTHTPVLRAHGAGTTFRSRDFIHTSSRNSRFGLESLKMQRGCRCGTASFCLPAAAWLSQGQSGLTHRPFWLTYSQYLFLAQVVARLKIQTFSPEDLG
ncbi:uncharacterized protein LOC124417287 [Gallus gallus]|uniref:uncharacterized protein LOC124417287 n=1 Tax=Gallus gallus TaxID=9031 RepID=UPI001F018853|nr:uncharacterized protein LOC124417287 [Gallus gallus]